MKLNTDKVITPCVNVCKIDYDTNLCIGCARTVDEITNWIFYSDEQRKKIMTDLEKRKNRK